MDDRAKHVLDLCSAILRRPLRISRVNSSLETLYELVLITGTEGDTGIVRVEVGEVVLHVQQVQFIVVITSLLYILILMPQGVLYLQAVV